METVEIIVYVVIAVILGSLVLAFVGGWNPQDTYNGLKRAMGGGQATDYQKITSDQLPSVILAFWDACGYGTTTMQKAVQITDNNQVNKSALFTYYKAASLCRTIQSASENCGSREDIVFANTVGPTLLNLKCDQQKLTITS